MLILNKRNIKKIIVIFFIAVSILKVDSVAVVNPTSDFYVNDYANILDRETKNYIISTNKSLYSQTGAQIVVVTVQNLGGQSLEEYSTELFRKFGIGDKNKNNGVLLLLALEERQFRIEVGYGLEGILPDGKTGRIQDEYIIPYLKQNDWNNGIKNGFSAILQEVTNEYNVEVGAEEAKSNEYTTGNNMKSFGTVGIPTISLIIGFILHKKRTNKFIISIIYIVIVSIINCCIFNVFTVGITKETLMLLAFITIFDFLWFIIALICGISGHGGYYGGGSSGGFSGGGSSGGGGSSRSFLKL